MPTIPRLEQIIGLVNERGFVSVKELGEACQVSEMTIRRDLDLLEGQKRLLRTYGGAARLPLPGPARQEGTLESRVDALIATAVNPKYDRVMVEIIGNKRIPIIAESVSIGTEETVVAVDNFQAGKDLGSWAGTHARQEWGGRAVVLDLSYYLANTQARSRGFLEGVRAVLPEAELALSIDAQSRYESAYQLTRDALTVYPEINIIFGINDITAWGAIKACQDLALDPQRVVVLPFGLEGETVRSALAEGGFCKAGLAMFPEIVGPACIEAAVAAYQQRTLPAHVYTPHAVVTTTTFTDIYARADGGEWQLRPEVYEELLPVEVATGLGTTDGPFPRRVGFIVPFSEHEWYKNLTACAQVHAARYGIELENVDIHQNLKDEIDLRRREIGRLAAQQIQPGDVVMIDGGPMAVYLAEEIRAKRSVTVITNAAPVFDILRGNPDNTLISTGGAFRHSSEMMVGPTAEGALRELRADKVFLMVTGISLNFGLSHTNISEVTIKQAMIRSAREVILLADHTYFGEESVIQVAPLSVVHTLITDDALPASARLDLTKLGIQILLAKT